MEKKNIKSVIIVLLFAMSLFSCKKSVTHSTEVLSINVDAAKSIDISEGKLIELETTDLSLLYEIQQIEFLKEKMIILSREKVVVFDKNGKFLFNISGKGEAPNEYFNLANIFVANEFIHLFDHMSKKILCFDEDGNFISSTKINQNDRYPLTDIYPLKNGKFIGKNMFQGDHMVIPAGSVLDENYQFVNTVKGRNITSGMTMSDNFYQYNDQILYWELLNDTIFSIVDYKKFEPKYFIDFEQYSIPRSERNRDIYDLIDFTNKQENRNRFASVIGYINEDDHYLRFRFGFREQTHYVFYDKLNKTSKAYRFEDKNSKFNTVGGYAYYNNGYIYLSIMSEIDMENNPYLVVFNETIFREK
jgi:hypothetical protein